MRCIHCEKSMIFDEDDRIYRCESCGVRRSFGGEWNIPEKYYPTKYQISKVKYINRVLSESFEMLTCNQCERLIGKYYNLAKSISKLSLRAQKMAVEEYHDEYFWRKGLEEDSGDAY